MNLPKYLILFFLLLAGNIRTIAQSTSIYNDPDADFKKAKYWYQQEKFSLAYPIFKHLFTNGIQHSNIPVQLNTETRFYYIVCGLKLADSLAESLAKSFIELEPNIPLVQRMNFHLAEFYFQKKDFVNAQKSYLLCSIANLNNNEIASLKFHEGYTFFVLHKFDKAKPLFNAVRQLPKDPNYIEANYYYGFISFYEKNYKEALAGFKVASADPEYKLVIPFYMSEIYYFNGQRDLALETGLEALQSGGQFYHLQLNQLVGHIYFEKRDYAKALPYLKEYVNNTEKVRREDLYELSYCHYEASDWTPAIYGFKQLSGGEDSLAQNSMYLLANAYLKTDDKANARNAFLFCSTNSSNAFQLEVSSFNYCKLSFELNYTDIALKGLERFISLYPQSTYRAEAQELLVNTLVNSSNFKEALSLFDKLPQKSEELQKIYPGILYGRAVELINEHQFAQADNLLSKLMNAPNNAQYLSLTSFWRGEMAYRSGKTDDAIIYFLNYLKSPRLNGQASVLHAQYNLGYCFLKKENFPSAKNHFSEVVRSINASSSQVQQDAFIRLADCDFMQKDFIAALNKYDQVIGLKLSSSDYALFQKAVIAGAMNKLDEKIRILQQFTQQYAASGLYNEALLELGNTYLANENYAAAMVPLEKLLNNKRAESLQPQVYLKLGVASFNLEKKSESLDYLKQLVAKYPNTQESADAIEYIRTLYVSRQQPGDYISFLKQNGLEISANEADSISFRSAMMRFEAKDFNSAAQGFGEYLASFSQGRYQIEANYYSAEIQSVNKANANALTYYSMVAAKSPNKFAERSCLQAARIYYFDLKDYSNAAKYYAQLKSIATQQENKLEAMRGLLRCQFKSQQWQEAAPNAKELLAEKGIASDDQMMANMVLAKNDQLSGNIESAITAYKLVIAGGRSELSAESQYRIAEIEFSQHHLDNAEKIAFEVIKKWGSYEYWVAKSYLLLGDIYFEQKDLFNAEATYKSIVENSGIPDLKSEAQNKLEKVNGEKNRTNKIEQQ